MFENSETNFFLVTREMRDNRAYKVNVDRKHLVNVTWLRAIKSIVMQT